MSDKINNEKNENGIDVNIDEFCNSNFIKINEEVQNWEEAIIKGGEILKKNGCVNDSYINAMINNVKKTNPLYSNFTWYSNASCKTRRSSFKSYIFITFSF